MKKHGQSLQVCLRTAFELEEMMALRPTALDAIGGAGRWPHEWLRYNFKAYPRFPAIRLPNREKGRSRTLEIVMQRRRSCRAFSGKALRLSDISAVIHLALRTTTSNELHRSYPSAGARFPVEIYAICMSVSGLERGAYYVDCAAGSLVPLPGKISEQTMRGIIGQSEISTAPLYVVYTLTPFRSMCKYGLRGLRFAYLEAGSAATTIELAFISRGLSSVWIGGFNDHVLAQALGLEPQLDGEYPVVMQAVGYKKAGPR